MPRQPILKDMMVVNVVGGFTCLFCLDQPPENVILRSILFVATMYAFVRFIYVIEHKTIVPLAVKILIVMIFFAGGACLFPFAGVHIGREMWGAMLAVVGVCHFLSFVIACSQPDRITFYTSD